MTRDSSQHPRPKRPAPRQEDRRQVNALRGVPLIGGLGLVFNDRRSYRERRRNRRVPELPPPCALLQQKGLRPAPGLFAHVSGWRPTAIGAWIRRHLKYPWRPKARPPEGRP